MQALQTMKIFDRKCGVLDHIPIPDLKYGVGSSILHPVGEQNVFDLKYIKILFDIWRWRERERERERVKRNEEHCKRSQDTPLGATQSCLINKECAKTYGSRMQPPRLQLRHGGHMRSQVSYFYHRRQWTDEQSGVAERANV
ncbi:unnamed protein product [Nezara viridula]|uniref:Uncharacterized protein n=1 Tax=Nezara viridula TaxID=85310 RepID=A0A9P0HSM5_NEZVI|nr:unnamed protein product [Nezara viridula]